MRFSVLRLWVLIGFLLIGAASACTSEVSQPPQSTTKDRDDKGGKKKKKKKTDTGDEAPCAVPTEDEGKDEDAEKDEDKADEADEDEANEDEGAELRLTAEVTYHGDIAEILADNCGACHPKGSGDNDAALAYDCEDPNAQKPQAVDLTSYAQVKLFAEQIVKHLTSTNPACKMPPSGEGLSKAEIETLKAWVEGGMEEGKAASAKDDEKEAENDDEDPSDPCAGDSSDDEEPGAEETDDEDEDKAFDLSEALNPPKLKECHDAGKVFIRNAGDCHKAIELVTPCDEAWVEKAYGGSQQIKDVLAKKKSEGWILDQCGMSGTKVFVYWYCLAKESKGKCVPESEISEDGLVIKTSCAKPQGTSSRCDSLEL